MTEKTKQTVNKGVPIASKRTKSGTEMVNLEK